MNRSRPAAGDLSLPSESDDDIAWVYLFLKWAVARPLFRVLFRPRLEGLENVPRHGPLILAGNHLDAGETILIPAMFNRRLTFPAKRELFDGRSPRGRLLAWFLRLVRQVPIDRSGGQASADGMGEVAKVLARGHALAMFPEGTRSPDGRLYKGHTGVARLALQFGVPVVPVGLIDTRLTKGPFGIPWYRHPVMRFGRPLDFSAYAEAGNNRDVLRWVTDQVMVAIQDLTGQTYLDMYAVGAKQALARGENIDHRIMARPGEGRQAPPVRPRAAA